MNTRKAVFAFCIGCMGFGLTPAQAQVRILPLGDSITSSFAPYSSYRYWLWTALVAGGYDVAFVGTQYGVTDGTPGHPNFDQHHEGHPGWTTQDALDNIDAIAAATQPDVVLIDLGANDVEEGMPLSTTMTNLEAIIAHLQAFNPNVVVLLAQPTPYRGPRHGRIGALAGVVGRVVRIEDHSGGQVYLVNLRRGFNVRKDTFDGTHTNDLGDQLIAARFYQVLVNVFP